MLESRSKAQKTQTRA